MNNLKNFELSPKKKKVLIGGVNYRQIFTLKKKFNGPALVLAPVTRQAPIFASVEITNQVVACDPGNEATEIAYQP